LNKKRDVPHLNWNIEYITFQQFS